MQESEKSANKFQNEICQPNNFIQQEYWCRIRGYANYLNDSGAIMKIAK